MNPQMFNSFLDGTKSAIEMAAVANATGLDVPEDGLLFPPCGVDDLPHVLRPRAPAACSTARQVEVVSTLERDGRQVSATCAGASMSCSRRRPTTPRAASANTACATDAVRPLRGAVPAVPPDRAGARHLDRRRRRCAARRPARRTASAATSSRPPSATCGPARCSTARAAACVWGKLHAGAREPGGRRRCRSAWRTACRCCATCGRGSASRGTTCGSTKRMTRIVIGGRWNECPEHLSLRVHTGRRPTRPG